MFLRIIKSSQFKLTELYSFSTHFLYNYRISGSNKLQKNATLLCVGAYIDTQCCKCVCVSVIYAVVYWKAVEYRDLTRNQFCSVTQLCPTLCDPMNYSTPSLHVLHQLLESTQTHVHWVSDAIQSSHPSCPLLLLPSIFPSIRVFSNESALRIRWPKYWSFSFNISPSSEHPGLTCFRMDWLALIAVQGTLKSLLQHHSSKASILRCSAFFTVQLSHPYMTTGKTIALNRLCWQSNISGFYYGI